MALVWFVDKSPRSRKPVQYKRLDDFTGPLPESDDLLPVLLPCALCCAQQQLTASLVAHQLQQSASQGLLAPPQTESSQYSEFLSLCQHVECLVEKSMARMNSTASSPALAITSPVKAAEVKKSIDDDMRLRSLRDSNRRPIIKPMQQQTFTNNHYVWRNEHSRDDKYKSRFHPMRNCDPVRDDLAVRSLLKPTTTLSPPVCGNRPPPHPNHRSRPIRKKAARPLQAHR